MLQFTKYIYKFIFHLFGINLRVLFSLYKFPKFIKDLITFKLYGGSINSIFPILYDYNDFAGNIKSQYFHQDLHVSSLIYQNKPINHIDVGSRIDGFVSNISVFMIVDVMDIRKLEIKKKNINFKRGDITNKEFNNKLKYMSVSCLHSIEHFGLGRYDDPVNPNGHIIGFNNLYKLLDKGALLYISFPVSSRKRIEFNAHRVFGFLDIFDWMYDLNIKDLELISFDLIDDKSNLIVNQDIHNISLDIKFGCGIYTLKKI